MGILRTILALAVVVYHSYKLFGLRMCGGQVAVESFYMISGFYMALILNEKYKTKDKKTAITMSKADIACYAETTEETVVRVLGFFKEQSILATEARKVIIKNKRMLEIIAEGF